MGQDESQIISSFINNNKIPSPSQIHLNKNHFEFQYIIGRGGFGKVWKVKYKQTQQNFALKEMSKLKIIDRKSEKSIKNEKEFLSYLHHNFIVNMQCSFQDYDHLYLVMDLLTGGDLRYHICHEKKFTENQTKFFCACVITSLEYIHSKNIIHRDIKPENLVLDNKGYVHLTDFGVAKKNLKDNSSETSGTPGYMAPEVLCAQNHSFPVDFFAIGVMAYEFMFGVRPYLGKNRKEIKEAVLAKQVHVHKKDMFEFGWSFESGDFINKMIYRKASKRLGYNGIEEVKKHKWFEGFDWDGLINKKMNSYFVPKKGDNFDKKYCEGIENIGTETEERYEYYKSKDKYKNLFINYTFIWNDVLEDNIKLIQHKKTISSNSNYNNENISTKSSVNNINNSIKALNSKKSKNNIFAQNNNNNNMNINNKNNKENENVNLNKNNNNNKLLHPSNSTFLFNKNIFNNNNNNNNINSNNNRLNILNEKKYNHNSLYHNGLNFNKSSKDIFQKNNNNFNNNKEYLFQKSNNPSKLITNNNNNNYINNNNNNNKQKILIQSPISNYIKSINKLNNNSNSSKSSMQKTMYKNSRNNSYNNIKNSQNKINNNNIHININNNNFKNKSLYNYHFNSLSNFKTKKFFKNNIFNENDIINKTMRNNINKFPNFNNNNKLLTKTISMKMLNFNSNSYLAGLNKKSSSSKNKKENLKLNSNHFNLHNNNNNLIRMLNPNFYYIHELNANNKFSTISPRQRNKNINNLKKINGF